MPIPCFAHAWVTSLDRLALAAAVTLVFALLGRAVRGVNWSGAMAGGLACFALFAGAGPSAFATLVALFAVTWLSTRLGYRQKQERGLAERREGRDAWQVLANLAAPALAALAFAGTGSMAWIVATIGAMAEAATDTVASEIGQSQSRDARMITTWQCVPAGTDGGLTIAGTMAGALAGTAIALVAMFGGILPARKLWIAIVAGFAGMLVDSLLGATIQRRRWLNNQGVNLVSTMAAAVFAYAICA